MLKDDLYTIEKITEANATVEVMVKLNKEHEIFKGHFPNQPLLPGACMLQMTREILQDFLQRNMRLVKADDIRFSSMVDPTTNKELKFILPFNFNETQQVSVNGKILNIEDIVCCKVKATFKLLP
jgi:3-hydroxyacyl-[acyl-carrier-protein] dehydratase